MRTQAYLLAAGVALLAACSDPTGPALSTGMVSGSGSGDPAGNPTMDPARLTNGR